MKKIAMFVVVAVTLAVFAVGCSSTSTVTEYDLATGKPIKVTTTNESVIDQVTKSTKDKTCYVWTKGWGGKLSVANITSDNPIPGFEATIFNLDKGVLTLHKDQQGMDNIADVIKACNASGLSVTSSGINGNTGSAAATPATASKSQP